MKTKTIKVSNGNKKIGKDTLIINITSATDCPSKKLGLCKHCGKCYAIRSEKRFPVVLQYRKDQTRIWDNVKVQTIAEEIASIRKGKIKYLRFSESGDFRKQEDINKMSQLADLLKNSGIKVYGYTARRDLDYKGISDNMNVNGSSFKVNNSYTAVNEFSPNSTRCVCDCKVCNICKVEKNKNIEVKFH